MHEWHFWNLASAKSRQAAVEPAKEVEQLKVWMKKTEVMRIRAHGKRNKKNEYKRHQKWSSCLGTFLFFKRHPLDAQPPGAEASDKCEQQSATGHRRTGLGGPSCVKFGPGYTHDSWLQSDGCRSKVEDQKICRLIWKYMKLICIWWHRFNRGKHHHVQLLMPQFPTSVCLAKAWPP